jgi:predicted TIM-barrel fold metal-dependent hydrolase
MRIDAFSHFLPPRLRDALAERRDVSRPGLQNWAGPRALVDIDHRVRLLDEEGIDRQVITTPNPSLESVFDAEDAQELARIANDGMADAVARHPDRFYGVATVSLLSVAPAIVELERATGELGLAGVLVYTNIGGAPLDAPAFAPFFDAAAELGVPVWLHPDRSPAQADYAAEGASRHDLHVMFGWPYETSVAMARLALDGLFVRRPDLRILTHHGGGMVPFYGERLAAHYGDEIVLERLALPAHDHMAGLRSFYADSVTSGSASALRTAVDFFGDEQVLFASDMPFGPRDGRDFLRRNAAALEACEISDTSRRRIWAENVLTFLTGPIMSP